MGTGNAQCMAGVMHAFVASDNPQKSGWRDGQQNPNIAAMRRRFVVLTGEAASHPFWAGLASHFSAKAAAPRFMRKLGISAQDLRDFVMAYCACFLAVSLYIA